MKGDNLPVLLAFTEYSQTNLGRNQSPFCTKFSLGVKKVDHFCLGRKKAAKMGCFTKIIYPSNQTSDQTLKPRKSDFFCPRDPTAPIQVSLVAVPACTPQIINESQIANLSLYLEKIFRTDQERCNQSLRFLRISRF